MSHGAQIGQRISPHDQVDVVIDPSICYSPCIQDFLPNYIPCAGRGYPEAPALVKILDGLFTL